MESSLTPIIDMWSKLKTTRVVILGNGKTRELGVKFAHENKLPVVTINYLPEELSTVFSLITRSEFLEDFKSKNVTKIPLVVPSSFSPSKETIALPIAEFEYLEGITRMNPNQIEFREDFVLFTILHLINFLAERDFDGQTGLDTFLYGFDFQMQAKDINRNGNEFLQSLLLRQRELFNSFLNQDQPFEALNIINKSLNESILDSSPLNKIKKSTKDYTEEALDRAIKLNSEMLVSMFNKSELGEVQIVAELTNNHLGDTDRLVEMVQLCKEQGASVVKIQKREIDVLYSDEERRSPYTSPFGKTLGDYRAGVELTVEQIEYLTLICAELKIPWFTSVLDLPSFEIIKRFSPVCIKIPSTVSGHINFIKAIADSDIEYVFVSTGGTKLDYINWIVETFQKKKIILMQCTSSYPTAPQDCNVAVLNYIRSLENHSSLISGYSSHDVGSLASQLAVALGARFVEKHIKLGSVEWVHFDSVALDLYSRDLQKFVEDLRSAERVLGSHEKRILPSEHHKYKTNDKHN